MVERLKRTFRLDYWNTMELLERLEYFTSDM
jgi:ABC-type Fe2+-enterobactin transport system substrate-binding protein